MVYAKPFRVIEGGAQVARDVEFPKPVPFAVTGFDPEFMAPPGQDLPYNPHSEYVERRETYIEKRRKAREAADGVLGKGAFRNISEMLGNIGVLDIEGLRDVNKLYGVKPPFEQTYLDKKPVAELSLDEIAYIQEVYPHVELFIGGVLQPTAAEVAHRPALREAAHALGHLARAANPSLEEYELLPVSFDAFRNLEQKSVGASRSRKLGAMTGALLKEDTARFVRLAAMGAVEGRPEHQLGTTTKRIGQLEEFAERMALLERHSLNLPKVTDRYDDEPVLRDLIQADVACNDKPSEASFGAPCHALRRAQVIRFDPSLWTGLSYAGAGMEWQPLSFAERHDITGKARRLRGVWDRGIEKARAFLAPLGDPEAAR